jgi:predicted RNase H-like HicB family nuclease
MRFHVIIEQDEAGYYVAEVPALPGCFSQGKTYEDAIANIKEAIEGWLEVMESKPFWMPDHVRHDKLDTTLAR